MTGEQLAALCYAEPPLAEIHGLARVVEVFLYVLAIISVVIVGLRVYVRGFLNGGKIWGVDDYLAVLGFVSYTTAFVRISTYLPSIYYLLGIVYFVYV